MKNTSILIRTFLFLLIIAASAVGLWSLFTLSIRLDEAQSIWISTKPVSSILYLTSQDVHVPLYGLLLHFWMQFFGSSIISARILSFIFFLLTLPALYILGKETSNSRIALLSVVLFSLSPFIIWYTSEARMYTLFTFITSLNNLYFLRLIRSEGRRGKPGYFFSLIFGFYTHYFFFLLVITQGVYLLLRIVGRIRESEKHNSLSYWRLFWNQRVVTVGSSLVLGAFMFFLPWLLYFFIGGSASSTQPLIPPPTSYNIFQTFVNFLFGFQVQGIQRVLVSLWPLTVVVLFFVFTRRQRIPVWNIEYFVLATFLPIILVFLGSYVRPIFLSRYLILVTPTLFFMIAWILMQYSRKASSYIISFLLLTMFSLMIFQNVSASTPVKENYEETSTYLTKNATPRDIIAVSAPFTVYPIEYSYTGTARITTIPQWNRFGEGSIPEFSNEDLQSQIEDYQERYERLFLVLSYDQGYEDDIREYFDGYELLNSEQFSPGLEIRVYKLKYTE